ncbi:MAG TPA: ABC transporter ATP-binding protein [Bryobacteraceae bacterium]|nr:ABC transporter ATP-binding protein [Bryobacteraceae bacterium]
MTGKQNGHLLSVRNLQVSFPADAGPAHVVDGVTFDLRERETLGIVGESGSGKSMTSLALLGLVPRPGRVTEGEIVFQGRDLRKLDEHTLRSIRGSQLAMVFQDPMTSLNPFLPVWKQITEVAQLHLGYRRGRAFDHAVQMLERVGIPDARARAAQYPHQFSGGMRQRVMIAIALACQPKLIIADEPTTALDVTIQAQILELLRKLKDEGSTAIILITHDLGIVAENADDVLVMYAGRVIESAPARELFSNPQNPYTRALLRCIPDPTARDGELHQISGQPPDVSALPPRQCPFAARCPEVIDRCREEFPPYHQVGENHWSLCWVR